ncbi:MAG: phosphotransferase [Acidimicrobiia bacterium]|nr:phosphotransferase [Acidimicrobiia bacterium]
MEHTEGIDGIDVEAVTRWLGERLEWLAPPLAFTKLTGGHSNFTYRVDDEGGRAFVVRRPPLGELLPMAHDMGREFTLISGLWPTPVPVPEPLAFCEDPEVTGAPFFAMGFVDGGPIYTEEDVVARIDGVADRAKTGPSFIDTLAALHAVDPDEVGLGKLGKRDSYVGRQLNRWYASWNASKNRDLPDVDRLHDFLAERLPEQAETRVVHGDYGLHNCVVGRDGTVLAVVDWEISTLGDPLADLAYCVNWWDRDDSPARMEGFDPPEALVERYGITTGRTSARSSTTAASTTGRRSASCRASTPATSTARSPPKAWTSTTSRCGSTSTWPRPSPWPAASDPWRPRPAWRAQAWSAVERFAG